MTTRTMPVEPVHLTVMRSSKEPITINLIAAYDALRAYAQSGDEEIKALKEQNVQISKNWDSLLIIAALRADADRYRWLREQHWNQGEMCVVTNPRVSIKLGYDCPSLNRLDAAIDAAMKECGK